jgi:hypothetical protein
MQEQHWVSMSNHDFDDVCIQMEALGEQEKTSYGQFCLISKVTLYEVLTWQVCSSMNTISWGDFVILNLQVWKISDFSGVCIFETLTKIQKISFGRRN